ncbi:CACNA1F [Symbiodinium microadriaticum]|nr:CACNA1F [Symbiodinium microadriaticum]
MYINTYGCDKFPSQYVMSNITKGEDGYADEYYKLRYGRMVLPVCNHPEAQPVLSTILFITFITLCGFILINITIAAVTAGINDRLDELRKEDLEEEMMGRMISGLSSMPNKSSTILTDPAMLLMLMKQVWKEHDDYAKKMARLSAGELEAERKKRERQEKRDSLRQQVSAYRRTSSSEPRVDRGPSALNEVSDLDASQYEDEQLQCGLYLFSLRYQSMYMRDLTGHLSYQFLVAGLVILAAVTEMWTLQNPESRANAEFVLLALQILFTLDLYCKVIATYPNYQIFFTNGWSIFDTILVIATWAPVMTTGMQGKGARIIGLLRVFRILRLLKMLTWIRELNVVLHSIASSVRALVYVILLLFAFFYHFGIAGVFLFAENDPQHFGTLWKAFVTLFQVSSLDDWSEIARTNMYGCDLYGYDTGEDHYDSQCQHPRGLGWFAAWYFIVVVIIGTMVLLSLFVGIIITSMELLKEGIKEEKEVWAKVRIKQKQYNMRDTTINNLLEIFDLIDIGQNGKLTVSTCTTL